MIGLSWPDPELANRLARLPAQLLPFPQELRPPLPTIVGNVDYLSLRRRLEEIDALLRQSGLEQDFAQWVQPHRRRQASPRRVGPPAPARGLQLVEAVVAPAAGGAPLVVQLPGGVRAELTAERQVPLVVALIRALEGRC